uniref:Retroviral polymerase SH3-like domain-containing protein n=1 Tax=Chenopodium quinoa TaxID=63459 RepID=A0A803L5I1_CHEQI
MKAFRKKGFKEEKRMKQELKCDYCGMKGHIKEGCFELIGYPPWYKGPKGKNVNKMAANVGRIEQSAQQDTPFDQDGEAGKNGNVKPDSNLISAVVQEVIRAFQDKQGGASTSGKTNGMSNFADIISISNVATFNDIFLLTDNSHDKFNERGIRSVLLGYPFGTKGYRLYDLQKRKIFISKDVYFKEHIFPFIHLNGNMNEVKAKMNQLPLVETEILIDSDEDNGEKYCQIVQKDQVDPGNNKKDFQNETDLEVAIQEQTSQ